MTGCMIENVFNVSKGIKLMPRSTTRSALCQYALDREKQQYNGRLFHSLCMHVTSKQHSMLHMPMHTNCNYKKPAQSEIYDFNFNTHRLFLNLNPRYFT